MIVTKRFGIKVVSILVRDRGELHSPGQPLCSRIISTLIMTGSTPCICIDVNAGSSTFEATSGVVAGGMLLVAVCDDSSEQAASVKQIVKANRCLPVFTFSISIVHSPFELRYLNRNLI